MKAFLGALLTLALLALLHCGGKREALSSCDLRCISGVDVNARVELPSSELSDLQIRVCRNADCNVGTPLVSAASCREGAPCTIAACPLAGPLTLDCSFTRPAPGWSGDASANTHLLDIWIHDPSAVQKDGDHYTVTVIAPSAARSIVALDKVVTYERVDDCGGNTCLNATLN